MGNAYTPMGYINRKTHRKVMFMTPHVIKSSVTLAVALLALSACAANNSPADATVEGAFLAPGAVAVQPYTRTIFSSSNF